MIEFDTEKIKKFNEDVIKEYSNSNWITDIINVNSIEYGIMMDEPINVSIHPRLNFDIFMKSPSLTPRRVFGLGRSIASGELKYLIDKLDENHNQQESLNYADLENNLHEYLGQYDSPIVVSSTNIFLNLLRNKNNRHLFDCSGNIRKYFDVPWHSMPSKAIDTNCMYIIDSFGLNWTYELFKNEYTGKEEKLNISIDFSKFAPTALIHSSIYFTISDEFPIYKIIVE